MDPANLSAVTLEGTVIHKSGLITGGQGSNQRQFNDQDVSSMFPQQLFLMSDLQKARDTYMQQLAELNRAKPKTDDTLLGALSRLDAEMSIANDDLVSPHAIVANSRPPSGLGMIHSKRKWTELPRT
jgi:structural maintenance of chromosome 1